MAKNQERGGDPSNSNNNSSSDQPLTWRMDPALSYSDWKIEVYVLLPHKKEHHCTYHVHKAVLAVGPKKSMYFDRLFQSTVGFAESTESTSRVEMNEVAAKAFPVLLDYLYSSPNELFNIKFEDTAPLYHLSDYFEIPSLYETVERMWESRKFPHSSRGVLYEHSKIFQIDKLKTAVMEACCRYIRGIGKNSHLADVADSEFWLGVIEKNGGTPNEPLCALVADYCASKGGDMEVYKTLLQEEDHFMVMSIETAMSFLELEQSPGHRDGGVDVKGFSKIQNECIEVLAASWLELDTDSTEGILAKLVPSVLASIFRKTVKKAKAASQVPTSIVVSGAGCDDVNGTYISCLRRADAPKFKMRGRWNGQDVDFSLYPWKLRNGYYRWILSILGEEHPGTDSDIDFYYCIIESSPPVTLKPPFSEWYIAPGGEGSDPVPSFEFLYD